MLEELAVLWRPDVPVEDNPAYVAKAREQDAIIEAALRRRTAHPPPPEVTDAAVAEDEPRK